MSSQLSPERADELVRLLTDGLVNIVDTTGEFLLKLDDGRIVDTKGWQGWEWTHGVALTALYHTILGWFESQHGLTAGRGAPKNINTMSPFYCLASVLRDGRVDDAGGRWRAWCDEWAGWVMRDLPRTREGGFQHITYAQTNTDQLWDDTLMMTVVPLAQIGILLDRPEYVAEASYQFLLHCQYLVDTSTGLWFHGYEFTSTAAAPRAGHNFARALWARGNCWITVAVPVYLELLGGARLGAADPVRRVLEAALRRQVDALLPLQDAGGMWHTLLVDPDSYVEASATAGFAAGIYMALRLGLIKGAHYRAAADRALAAVVGRIAPEGELADVSFGTGMGSTLQFYRDIPITPMPYGQALAMLALVEWQRLRRAEGH